MIVGGSGKFTITITGAEALEKLLQSVPNKSKDKVASALRDIAIDLKQKSSDLAPVDKGALRGSAYSITDASGDKLDAEIGFREVYATRQHEELEWQHPNGGQAKYLEQPYKENLPKYTDMIANAVKEAVES